MNIDNFRRRIMMGIVPMRKWEKLADVTTTEDLMNLVINSGDNGQVLDDYDVLMVSALFQPTSESVKSLQVSVTGKAWGSPLFSGGSSFPIQLQESYSYYTLIPMYKTPIGIMADFYFQYNHTSVANLVGRGDALRPYIQTRLTSNSPASVMDNAICNYEHFNAVNFGCYTGKPITAGARVQIWGAKL